MKPTSGGSAVTVSTEASVSARSASSAVAYFLEGIEKKQAAVVSDEKTLLESVDRSKWDILQR